MALEFVLCVIATWAFAYLSNSPIKPLLVSGFIGSVGYYIYLYLKEGLIAFFIGSLVIALFSEIASRILKTPATVFLSPAIIPMVPGLSLYRAMYSFAVKDYPEAIELFSFSMTGIISMAMSLAISTSIFKLLHRIQEKEKTKKQ